MAIELVKEPLKINQAVRDELMQFSVQGDVIIPDIKPDIIKVLCIDSDVIVNNEDILHDRVVVEGAVNFRIIYLCKDEERPVRALNASLPFKEPIDAAGTRQGMKVHIDSNILNTEFEILNERKVMVKSIAQIDVRVVNTVEVNLITDIKGVDDIQKLRDNIRVCTYIGEGSEKCVAKEELEVSDGMPSIFEVLRSDVRVSKNVKISDNKIIVKGDISVSTLYSAEDEERSLKTIEGEIPFTQFIDIMGIHEDALCDVDIIVKDVDVRVTEDGDGEARILDYEITMAINARGFEWQDKEAISDTYSPQYRIEVDGTEVAASQLYNETNNQLVVKEGIELQEGEHIGQIYSVLCKPCVPDVKIMDDKVAVEGVVDVWVLYCTGEERKTMCHKGEIPYSNMFESKGATVDMSFQAKLDIGSCGHTLLSGGEVEVRVALNINTKLFKDNKIKVINKVEQVDVDEQESEELPSITIYFIQPGDTLWKIGKRYNTTIEELMKLNEIPDTNVLVPGQQVFIQKRTIEKALLRKIM